MTQSTLWPEEAPQAPQTVSPTRRSGLTMNEALSACQCGSSIRRTNWARGAHLLWEDGGPVLVLSNGERSRRPYSPTGFDKTADNWEIIPKEADAA
jgi:hypothetical protein